MLQNGEHQTERLALLIQIAKTKFLRNSFDSEGKWTPFEQKKIAEEGRDGWCKDYSWFGQVGLHLDSGRPRQKGRTLLERKCID